MPLSGTGPAAAPATVAAAPGPSATTATPPRRAPLLPVTGRLSDLPSRTPLDDRTGRMAQAERDALVPRPEGEPDGATVTSLWNGSLSVPQRRATVRDTSHDGAPSPGATGSPGFTGSSCFTGSSGFTANGTAGAPAPRCAGT